MGLDVTWIIHGLCNYVLNFVMLHECHHDNVYATIDAVVYQMTLVTVNYINNSVSCIIITL